MSQTIRFEPPYEVPVGKSGKIYVNAARELPSGTMTFLEVWNGKPRWSKSVVIEDAQARKKFVEEALAADARLGEKALEQAILQVAFVIPKELATRTQAASDPDSEQDAMSCLESMAQTRRLRFPQDFVAGKLWYGIVVASEKMITPKKLLVNSDRELLKPTDLPSDLWLLDRGCDVSHISKDAVLSYLGGESGADLELLADLRDYFGRYAAFRDARIPMLLAAWTLGTYCYRIFDVFPYLALRSPQKRCGKSRVLDEPRL